MASAFSSLRKMKKVPLPGIHKPSHNLPPIDGHGEIESEDVTISMLLEEVTKDIVTSRFRNRRTPTIQTHGDISHRSTSTPLFDTDLMASMAARLASLESKVRLLNKELFEKNKTIEKLQIKIRLLTVSDSVRKPETSALERKCAQLQRQVKEMEEFLEDYGMVWVGESEELSDTEDESAHAAAEKVKTKTKMPTDESSMNYDHLVAKLSDLNFLSGEGIAKIQHTVAGARLKIPDPINFILYSNGLILFNGPFRPFTDRATQQLVHDILDGYFPTELQSRYPDGVVFKLTDKRDVHFKNMLMERFEGEGHILGGQTTKSVLLRSDVMESAGQHLEESVVPGTKLNVDQFLNRLPRSVIKSGKVVDIRSSIRDALCGTETKMTTTVVNDSDLVHTTTAPITANKTVDDCQTASEQINITTLKIKLEDGNNVLILKMQNTDTVGDIRKHINNTCKVAGSSYDIVSGFPVKLFDDDSATLQHCGLTPSALLYVRHRKK